MPKELYEQVKDEIPKHIGVYVGESLEHRPKKQELGVDEQILKNSLIRSLAREFQSKMKNNDQDLIKRHIKEVAHLKRECREYQNRYLELRNAIPRSEWVKYREFL